MLQRNLEAGGRTRTFTVPLALAILLSQAQAHAQTAPQAQAQSAQPIRGTILHIDGEEVVVDLGKTRVSDTQSLTVYRAIEVRHPITHRALRDRFVIGTLAIVQVGDTLSVAKAISPP